MNKRADLHHWMRVIPDNVPLQRLSIPGTHNSPACHKALPSVRCQLLSPLVQLENGIRFLDVRLQVDKPGDSSSDSLLLVHSVFPVALCGSRKFRTLYNDILAFLRRNPSETIILSLKREGRVRATDDDLAQKLHDHYISDQHWVRRAGIPTLGEARGKIVLLRRFHPSEKLMELHQREIGIDGAEWTDNCPDMSAGDVYVQDFYKMHDYKHLGRKIKHIFAQFQRAKGTAESADDMHEKSPLVLNFLSASHFWKRSCWPDKVAAWINPAVTERMHKMLETKDQRVAGITVMDWVGVDGTWDLVYAILAMNDDMFAMLEKR